MSKSLQLLVLSFNILPDNDGKFCEMVPASEIVQADKLGAEAEFFEKGTGRKLNGKIVRVGRDSILVDLSSETKADGTVH